VTMKLGPSPQTRAATVAKTNDLLWCVQWLHSILFYIETSTLIGTCFIRGS
jgi:hypothetical protein